MLELYGLRCHLTFLALIAILIPLALFGVLGLAAVVLVHELSISRLLMTPFT